MVAEGGYQGSEGLLWQDGGVYLHLYRQCDWLIICDETVPDGVRFVRLIDLVSRTFPVPNGPLRPCGMRASLEWRGSGITDRPFSI